MLATSTLLVTRERRRSSVNISSNNIEVMEEGKLGVVLTLVALIGNNVIIIIKRLIGEKESRREDSDRWDSSSLYYTSLIWPTLSLSLLLSKARTLLLAKHYLATVF